MLCGIMLGPFGKGFIPKSFSTSASKRIEMGKHSYKIARSLFDKYSFIHKYTNIIENEGDNT